MLIDFSTLGQTPKSTPTLTMFVPSPQGIGQVKVSLHAYRFNGAQLEFVGYGKNAEPADETSIANGTFIIESSRGSCFRVEELDRVQETMRAKDAA